MIRNLLALIAVVAFGYAWWAAFTISLTGFGVALAISAVCVLAVEGICYTERRRDTMRLERERVWMRRDRA